MQNRSEDGVALPGLTPLPSISLRSQEFAMERGFHISVRCVVTFTWIAAAILSSTPRRAVAASADKTTVAERLVADALRAEIGGDSARRTALLDRAIQTAPDYRPARWHSGQIEADGKW